MKISDLSTPKVTCICNTRSREVFLKRSIECFQIQTYPNKELLIVYEDNDPITDLMAQEYSDERIKFLKVSSQHNLNLGGLRNFALEHSKGELICIWDDDDWYHSKRIEMQVECILTSYKSANALLYLLIYDSLEKNAFLGQIRLWEGSLMCLRSVLVNDMIYDKLSRGEDTKLLQKLVRQNMMFPLIKPQLYIYVYHGNNTWNREHFQVMCSLGQKLSAQASRLIGEIIEGKLSFEEGSNLLDKEDILSELMYIRSNG